MKKIWAENKISCIGIGILVLIFMWCILRMISPKAVWCFTSDSLIPAQDGLFFEAGVLGDKPGIYVDNSMDYGEIFVSSPALNLNVGSYDITIEYLTETDGQSYSFVSEYPTYRVIMGREREPLEPERQSKTLSVYYWDKLNEFQVNTRYGGEGYLFIQGIHIKQTRAMERMVLSTTFFTGMVIVLFWWMKKEKKNGKILIYGIATALIAGLPLLNPYLYKTDDLPFHLLRIEGIAEGLRTGQLPVRIQPEWMNGYGYPVSVFYGDGILAIAGLLRLIGFPLQTSYKIYAFFINGFTFATSCFCIKRIFKKRNLAAAAGFLYTMAPYRLIIMYVQGAVGEYTAYAFLPLIFLGIYEIITKEKEERKYSWVILTFGLTGIIQSHILSCEMVGLFLIITCIILWKKIFKRDQIVEFLKCSGVTLGINLFFLIPFLSYMREDLRINSEEYGGRIQSSGTFLNQLFQVFPHGYGGERSVVDGLFGETEMPMLIGVVFLAGLLFFAWEVYVNKIEVNKEIRLGKFCFFSGIITLWMTTIWFPWDRLYDANRIFAVLISKLQFSRRILGLASVLLMILLCVVIDQWEKKRGKKAEGCLLCVFLIGACITGGYFFSSMNEKNNVIYVADVESLNLFDIGGGEYVYRGVAWKREKMPADRVWNEDGILVTDLKKGGTNYEFVCNNISGKEQNVEVPMLYYRGYEAIKEADGEKIALGSGENGKIRVTVPKDYSGKVKIYFKEALSWRISELISLMTAAGLLFYGIREYRKVKDNKAAYCQR